MELRLLHLKLKNWKVSYGAKRSNVMFSNDGLKVHTKMLPTVRTSLVAWKHRKTPDVSKLSMNVGPDVKNKLGTGCLRIWTLILSSGTHFMCPCFAERRGDPDAGDDGLRRVTSCPWRTCHRMLITVIGSAFRWQLSSEANVFRTTQHSFIPIPWLGSQESCVLV